MVQVLCKFMVIWYLDLQGAERQHVALHLQGACTSRVGQTKEKNAENLINGCIEDSLSSGSPEP